MKKLLTPFVVLIVLSLVLTACGPSEPEVVVETVEVEVVETVEVVKTVEVEPAKPTEEEIVPASEENPIELRIGISMTPQELQTFLPLLDAIDQAHPEWILVLEQTPQSSQVEKLNANAAAGTLPDIQELVGASDLIIRDVFVPMEEYIEEVGLDLDDFYQGALDSYTWDEQLMALPFVSAPDLLFYNIDMFDAAGLEYPTNDWTHEDLKEAALKLTLDSNGNNAESSDFNPDDIVQWGFNSHPGALGSLGGNYVRPWGDDFCANENCTEMNMTSDENIAGLAWWYDFVVNNHGALSDVYGGSQTGVPGDPFVNGFTAMGFNGFFAIGQIQTTGSFEFGVVQRPVGPEGPSTNTSPRGYAIAANSDYPDQAWLLIQELTSDEFLAEMWAKSGHSVPARRSAAQSVKEMPNLSAGAAEAILAAAEYAQAFPLTAPGSFEAYLKTVGMGVEVFSTPGLTEDDIAAKYAEMEAAANTALAEAAGN